MIQAFFDWWTAPRVEATAVTAGIFIAILAPFLQHRFAIQDARNARERRDKDTLQRLTVGLRVEIEEALAVLKRQADGIDNTLKGLQDARKMGVTVAPAGPIRAGSMVVTDAVVYRAIASELGRLPEATVKYVVRFYSMVLELGRIADAAPTAEQAFGIVKELSPRLRMWAALVLKTLEKFKDAGFSMSADTQPTWDEVKTLAAQVDYPLEQVARERGIIF